MLGATITDRARLVVDELLGGTELIKRSELIKKVEAELGVSNLTNVVGSLLDRGIKKGKYIKRYKGVYILNNDYCDKDINTISVYGIEKVMSKIEEDLSVLSSELLDSHIDGNLSDAELSNYKVLKNIHSVLTACTVYYNSKDMSDLKDVLNSLK